MKPMQRTIEGIRELKTCLICEHHRRCKSYAIRGHSLNSCIEVANNCDNYIYDEVYYRGNERIINR